MKARSNSTTQTEAGNSNAPVDSMGRGASDERGLGAH